MILVLDDIAGVRVAFSAVLRRMSMPHHSADCISAAQAVLPLHSWTAFVLDLELPDGNGLELLEWIRTHDAWQRIPAAIITANPWLDAADEHRVLQAGATLHVGALGTDDIETICRGLIAMGGRAPHGSDEPSSSFRSARRSRPR